MEAQMLQGIAALAGAAMTIVTAIASAPFARRAASLLHARSTLARERDDKAAQLDVMRATANAWREAHDAMRADIVATQASIIQLREAHQRESARVAVLEARLDVLAPKFLAALRYITDLHGFVAQLTGRAKVAGAELDDLPCPPVPAVLAEDLTRPPG